ncbi:MAG: hypothetical protein HUU38_24715 [Anaerolineales bacterium]|nr:hypothetical protein [Anaerolineales bacterium]
MRDEWGDFTARWLGIGLFFNPLEPIIKLLTPRVAEFLSGGDFFAVSPAVNGKEKKVAAESEFGV